MVKIAIVGADGTNKAWTPERIEKAKIIIKSILEAPIKAKGLVGHSYRWTAMGFPSWFYVKPLPNKTTGIVLVSGHCPVGEVKTYCINCGMFLEEGLLQRVKHDEERHQLIEVYDKGGVDTWAEIIATELGIKKEIYPAEVNQWEDKKVLLFGGGVIKHKGYRSRNIQIAEVCNVLYDIEPKGSCEHCGGRGFTSKHPNFLLYGKRCRICHGTGVYSCGTWTLNYAKKFGKEVHQVVIE